MQSEVLNMDCIAGMKQFPDQFFDLAVVDPVYGDVKQGGYMKNVNSTARKARAIEYNLALWNQEKTPPEYFTELFRVSKNQIVWGGNYFMESIHKDSQCWIVWDKKHPPGIDFADCELAWTSFDRATRIFRYRWNGMLQEDMKHKEKRIHPTQKPVDLYEWILKNFAEQGDKILDTQVGSGSSRIAAYNLGFDYVGFEIDEGYFKAQEERFRNHTAQLRLF
jgi:site-specific DNA-methyltransferase (adenine-specific)